MRFQPLKGTNGRSDAILQITKLFVVWFQPLKGTNGRSDSLQGVCSYVDMFVSTPQRNQRPF